MGPVHPDQVKIDSRLEARAGALKDDDGVTIVAGRIGGPRANAGGFQHDPETPTHLNLARFADWRMSKCLPRNLALEGDRLAELSQATLELAGEAGEVAEIVLNLATDPFALESAEFRAKLIDEIGDVIFCASWLSDAWGGSILRIPNFRPQDAVEPDVPPCTVPRLERLSLLINCYAGLLANSAKKVICQGREQDVQKQQNRIASILCYCTLALSVVKARFFDATARNVEKLDARFPNGHPLLGGGIRTGKGA